MSKKLKSKSPLDAASCSPSSDTPETDAMASMRRTTTEWKEHSEKLERERDEWHYNALLKMAVKQLSCMWCGELVHAPKGYEPGTPLSEDQRGQAYREHVSICKKHPIRDAENEIEELRSAIRETIMENLHLADGDNCTLKRLKDAIGFDLDSPENVQAKPCRAAD